MTGSDEIFYIKLVIRSKQVSNLLTFLKVPNRRNAAKLYLYYILAILLVSDNKLPIHVICNKQTELLKLETWYYLLQVYDSAFGFTNCVWLK